MVKNNGDVRLGIPRTLFYFVYFPLWERFFTELGVTVVKSAETSKPILDAGVEYTVTDACVPIKLMHGHVAQLVGQGVDYLFVPRIVSTNGRSVYCPKFLGLPDMLRSSVPELPPLIDVRYDARKGRGEAMRCALLAAAALGVDCDRTHVEAAFKTAYDEHKRYEKLLESGLAPEQAMQALRHPNSDLGAEPLRCTRDGCELNIVVVGYPYLLYDKFINRNLITKLGEMGARVLTSDMLSEQALMPQRTRIPKDLFWTFSEKVVCAAYHYLDRPSVVDGMIHLTAFSCGPDSVVGKLLETRAAECDNTPFMSLMIDEHTGEAGVLTRLEAFVDMIRRREKVAKPERTPPPAERPRRLFTKRVRKVTFPFMGTLPAVFDELLSELGNEVIMPARPNRSTLTLGTAHAPEFACLPLKILLGTYLEAIERGADTIVTSGGIGPCRAGLYTMVQDVVLKQLGVDVDIITLEPPRIDIRDFVHKIDVLNAKHVPLVQLARLVWRAWKKITVLDELERLTSHVRAHQASPGITAPVWRKVQSLVNSARTLSELASARSESRSLLEAVPKKPGYTALRVGIVGEIYVLIEPSSNLELEEMLGEMGVETTRSIYMTGWAHESNLLGRPDERKAHSAEVAAKPYLAEMIGGHGQESVGHAVEFARAGFDGVIQLSPFTCIPEIVAKSALDRVSMDFGLPVLSISFDEQTGKAGLLTRVEAFVDLLQRRRTALVGRTD